VEEKETKIIENNVAFIRRYSKKSMNFKKQNKKLLY